VTTATEARAAARGIIEHMASGSETSAPVEPSDIHERWSSTVVLGDGESVLIRPIRPTDAPALAAFHERQSRDSIYRRYFSPKPHLRATELEHFTVVDFVGRAALVVERYGEFIAWGSYERWPGRDDADAAFQVDDAHQGKGIATLLLEHLAAVARSNGIVRFTAEVLADNRPMLAVFARAGWPVERRFESGVVDLDFSLEDTDEFLDSVERREQRAESRAVARLLLPRAIAVVGASDAPGSIGEELWRHVTAAAKGPVFAVNPFHETVGGRPSCARLQDVPADVNLAVVAVPAAALSTVIDDCIAARVRGAVLITSVEGTDVDMEPLVTKARRFGVRLIGPGSMGVASPRQSVGVDALLVPADLPPGNVAISLQSGSLGASVLRLVDDLQIGLSWFVSLGDKSDVSGNDLLQFWEDDDTTGVIAMYTESVGNARKFARIARRVSRRRPIVAVHTGAAAIGPSGGALYQQAGLIEVPTVAAMLDTARVLSTQPPMRGSRVAVLANARSPQTLGEAALHTAGLEAVPSPRRLDWRSSPEDYGDALSAALVDDGIDAVMIIHAPPMADQVDAPVDAIEAAAKGATKPIVTVMMGGTNGPLRRGSTLPAFSFPEPAAGVLGRVHLYGAWLADEADMATHDVGDIDRARARAVISAAVEHGDEMLAVGDVVEVMRSYGITAPETRKATAADAVAVAEAIGYPVAVKAERRHLGRSLLAGVALDLAHDADVVEAVGAMQEALGDDAANVVIQPMVAPGLDLRIRSTVDDRLGPLIAIGLGGSGADLLADEASRLAPLTTASATALVAGSRAGPALHEAGLPAPGVVDTLLRVAQLVGDHPEIESADLNPIMVSEDCVAVTDAVIHVRRSHPATTPIRRLD
jgi:acyl-CoA synthetase (NDP forming)/GNAT superfamily N-acetyltransferase